MHLSAQWFDLFIYFLIKSTAMPSGITLEVLMSSKKAALSVLALSSKPQTQGYINLSWQSIMRFLCVGVKANKRALMSLSNWPVSSRPARRWPPPSCAPGLHTDRCCQWATPPHGWSGSLYWCTWIRRFKTCSV